MSDIQQLEVFERVASGKGHARRGRGAGLVPAIIYGGDKAPLPVSVSERALLKILRSEGFLATQFNLSLEGKSHHVLPRAVQFDSVSDRPIHVDFMRVTGKTRIHVKVRVHFLNEDACAGLRRGGVLNVVRHEIDLVCAVAQIPDHLEVDLSGFEIGDSVHVHEIALPEGVELGIADRDFTVATVAAPTVMTEAQEASEEDAAAEDEEADGEDKAQEDAD